MGGGATCGGVLTQFGGEKGTFGGWGRGHRDLGDTGWEEPELGDTWRGGDTPFWGHLGGFVGLGGWGHSGTFWGPPRLVRGDPRNIVEYRDLDAPEDVDFF